MSLCDSTSLCSSLLKFITFNFYFPYLAQCDKFVIDVAREIVIIYERFYEIYGDILAANNNFEIGAYEMGKLHQKIF